MKIAFLVFQSFNIPICKENVSNKFRIWMSQTSLEYESQKECKPKLEMLEYENSFFDNVWDILLLFGFL
jgi:hypothetical protein